MKPKSDFRLVGLSECFGPVFFSLGASLAQNSFPLLLLPHPRHLDLHPTPPSRLFRQSLARCNPFPAVRLQPSKSSFRRGSKPTLRRRYDT